MAEPKWQRYGMPRRFPPARPPIPHDFEKKWEKDPHADCRAREKALQREVELARRHPFVSDQLVENDAPACELCLEPLEAHDEISLATQHSDRLLTQHDSLIAEVQRVTIQRDEWQRRTVEAVQALAEHWHQNLEGLLPDDPCEKCVAGRAALEEYRHGE